MVKLFLENEEPEVKQDYVPSLYDIHKSLDVIKSGRYNGIKGEHYTRMITFTSFVMGKNSVILEGQRSSGKSNIMEVVGTYCKNLAVIDRASDKAHKRNEQLNKASHVMVPEANKVDNSFVEALKDWGEGKATTYTVLDEYKNARTFTLNPRPFITSRADENDMYLGEELISRLITLKTDSSVQMNKNVITSKFQKAQNPFKKDQISDDATKGYQEYVKSLPDIYDMEFIYCPGKTMSGAIPSLFSDARRDTDKYLKNTYGIALFHYNDRMVREINGKRVLFITPADIWYNHIIFGDALIRSALKCSDTERFIIDILKTHAKENTHSPDMRVRDIHQVLIENGITASMGTVDNYCKNLFSNGYIVRNESKRPYTYETSKDHFRFEFNIDWKEIVEESKTFMKNSFPEYADEYIRRFCTDPIKVIHPFDGTEKNVLEWEDPEKDIHGIKKKKQRGLPISDNKTDKKEKVLQDVKDGKKDMEELSEKYGEEIIQKMLKEGDLYEKKAGVCDVLE